jgi:uncharacterized membrane protein YdjX (TVP38/TMEM64 family)
MAAMAALGLVMREVGGFFDRAWIDTHIQRNAVRGYLLFVAFAGALTGVGVPRQLVSFLGGYAFGAVAGTLAALAGTGLGLTLTYGASRLLGRGVFGFKPGADPGRPRLRHLRGFLTSNAFTAAVMIRLLPAGNNFLTNVLAGTARVGFLPYLAGSLTGYVPQTLVFALLGSGIRVGQGQRLAASVLLFAAATWLGIVLLGRYRRSVRHGAGQE